MKEEIISRLCAKHFSSKPDAITRCGIGTGNYVYRIQYGQTAYIVRCSREHPYHTAIRLLEKLSALAVPVPRVLGAGMFQEYHYLILSYIEGQDIGLVNRELSGDEKKAIAKRVVEIQNRVAGLDVDGVSADWTWISFIEDMLNRAEERIKANGYFDTAKVDCLRKEIPQFYDYFTAVEPVPYLDDISTKNLLVHNGQLSGIIDLDWIEVGDRLTQPALTNMALLHSGYDTDYVQYLLEEMRLNDIQKKAVIFYTLMYCVDFMGERGTRFMDKVVDVNEEVINRLNSIYDMLWNALQQA